MFLLLVGHCFSKAILKSNPFSECTDDKIWDPMNIEEGVGIDTKIFSLGPNEFACMRGSFALESKDKFIAYTGNESSRLQFSNPFYLNPQTQDMDIIKLTCADNTASCKIQAVTVLETRIKKTEESNDNMLGLFTTRSHVKYGYEGEIREDENYNNLLTIVTLGPYKRTLKYKADDPDLTGITFNQTESQPNENYGYCLGLQPSLDPTESNKTQVKAKYNVTIDEDKSSDERECLFELEKTYVFPNDVVAASKEEVEENSKKYNFEIAPPSPTPQQTPQQTPKQTQKPPKLSKFALIIIISISCALVLLIVIFVIYVIIQRRKDVTKSDASIAQQLI